MEPARAKSACLVTGRSWSDRALLSEVEGPTTNGLKTPVTLSLSKGHFAKRSGGAMLLPPATEAGFRCVERECHGYPGDGVRHPVPGRRAETAGGRRGPLRQDDPYSVQHRRQYLSGRAHRRGHSQERRGRHRRHRDGEPPQRPRAAQGRRHQPGGTDRGSRHRDRLLQVHEKRDRGQRRRGLGAHAAGRNPGRAEPASGAPRYDVRSGPEHQRPGQRGWSAGQQLLRRPLHRVGQDH